MAASDMRREAEQRRRKAELDGEECGVAVAARAKRRGVDLCAPYMAGFARGFNRAMNEREDRENV